MSSPSEYGVSPINNPPMPFEQYRDKAYREWAAMFAVVVISSLLFAGIVYPWQHELAQVPFWLMFLALAWLVTGRAK